MNNKLSRILVLVCCVVFGLGLAGFAYTGSFTRYWADDYCYNAVLNQDGFWKAQISFYRNTSDRYSVIPLVGISEVFGPQAIRYWPPVAVVLGVGVLAWAIWQVAGAGRLKASRAHVLLAAEIVMFFTFWQAPNLYQALYWRTGMLTYFMPLVFQLLLAGWVLRFSHRKAPTWAVFLAGLLAFWAGGFSETTAALQMGAVLLSLAWVSVVGRANLRASAAFRLLLAALVGTALAMIALYVSPANAARLKHFEEQAGLVDLVILSLRFGVDFMIDTVKTQPLPSGVLVMAALALGLLDGSARERLSLGRWALTAAGVAAVTYLLLVCVMAPSVYIQVAYPEYRALIAARLVMTAGLVGLGWASGWAGAGLGRRILPGVRMAVGAALLLVLLSLYPLRALTVLAAELPAHRQRAAAWDARDLEIRQKRQAGEQDISVVALDSVAGLMDLHPETEWWVNNCAARTYQIESLSGYYP